MKVGAGWNAAVDSSKDSREIWRELVRVFGTPWAVGRYLKSSAEGVAVLTAAEADFLRARGVHILLVYGATTVAGEETSAAGKRMAAEAVQLARALGAPAHDDVAIFADVEAGWTATRSWAEAWTSALEDAGFISGLYGTPELHAAIDVPNAILQRWIADWKAPEFSAGGWEHLELEAPNAADIWQCRGSSFGGIVDLDLVRGVSCGEWRAPEGHARAAAVAPPKLLPKETSPPAADNWSDRSTMVCETCLHFAPQKPGSPAGRCRRRSPGADGAGWPAVMPTDWCGEHKIARELPA